MEAGVGIEPTDLKVMSLVRHHFSIPAMVCVEGFEPTTTRIQGEDSNQTELHTEKEPPYKRPSSDNPNYREVNKNPHVHG